jgi:hypothetical protein
LKKCQEEFYNPNETSIQFPFLMDEDEKSIRLREIKYGNITLIGEFYILNQINIKIISECVDFLIFKDKINDTNIRTLCELTKKISKKIYYEDNSLLMKIINSLEDL